MNIIVHMPKTEIGLQKLSEKVAEIHAMAIKHQLEKSTCSKAEKLELIKVIRDSVKFS